MTQAFCWDPFEHFKVNCEGDVCICCNQKYGVLGNLLQTPLDEIWNSPLANEIRRSVTEGWLHPCCQIYFCRYKFLDLKKEMREIKHESYPISVELDLPNSHCNLVKPCLMCCRSKSDFWPETDRLQEVCKAVSPWIPGMRYVHVQGFAEAFHQGRIFDVLEWVGWVPNDKCVVSTITNGILLDERTRNKFFELCPRVTVCFSMDAATPETYRKIRQLDLYGRVKKNLLEFGKNRDRQRHELWINNNINTLNVHEVVGMVEDAAEAGVDRIQFGPTDPTHNFEGGLQTASTYTYRLFEKAERQILRRAKELGVAAYFQKPLHLGLGEKTTPVKFN